MSAERTVFAGRPIVIKIGGVALERQREAPGLWRAILALHEKHAGGVLLVHGGGKAVDRILEKLGMATERKEGLRVTPPEQMDVIAGVLAGSTNKSLVGAINREAALVARAGARAVGLCLGDGGATQSRVIAGLSFDPGRVGEVSGGDGRLLRELLRQKFLPVIACVGIDDDGELLNINGDDAAAGVARVLGASALVLLTDVEGVKGADGRIVSEMNGEGVEAMIARGEATGGMIAKLRAAHRVAQECGLAVTIMSGTSTDALERWALGERVGTTVVA